jgi:integrase
MANYGVKRRGVRFTARPYIPGRGHVWAGTFDSEDEAVQAALAKIEEERRLPANKETVASFAARWVRDYPRPKDSTNDRYRADAERFAKVHGERKLHEITVREARPYAKAHRHDLGALRAMFSDARREGLVTGNPFSELRIPKGPGRSEIVVATPEELGELAEIARREHGRFGPVFRAIIVFAAYTGLRPGELFGLDWSDIDFEAETVHVRQQFHKRRLTLPKSGKTRTAFLPPPAAQALRAMPRAVGGELVFAGKEGQRITQSALSGYWGKVRSAFLGSVSESRRMDFERVKGSLDFYAVTRHFCATYLVEQGVESWIVARQLGHEDGGRLVERTYGHPRDEVARERLRRAYGGNVEPLRAVEEATG